MNHALIIFIKNPELGKVKTRLAATIGNEKALEVFKKLLVNIHDKSLDVRADKLLFYSFFVDKNDIWENDVFKKYVQNQSPDLGQRMLSAFEEAKDLGYVKVLIVGSDIYEVSTEILQKGFELLEDAETVLGPSHDGGYYAIGFNFEKINSDTFLQDIFLNKTWSHEHVAQEALDVINSFSYTCNLLPSLSDIDTEEDLKNFPDLYNIL
ncbi:glycosyltransferase [Lacihabitans sp. CCS-44]|uniref:TIGR04282 family arsenosugar biosynthesis glycosyltransferase n=1 Tax=Lacihabitans sp. CCS-44 TaxID=2487331 RepID=UPI0020CF3133|nr:TIGR04282 family arsenosugar biosynthesis glycosyltransferase [Lacihabitans sp. CCS-44]MCP9754679.1 glycosyltransferase [Lacihabitans sp. CCS-44]